MSYGIRVIRPKRDKETGVFFASEEETEFIHITLDPLKNDIIKIIQFLNEINESGKYVIDELNLTVGITTEEQGKISAGISLKIPFIGGNVDAESQTAFTNNEIMQIKIKKIK